MKSTRRILFTVLNWGLGHASRSIPLINALIEREVEIILASDGRALDLLRAEFPQLQSIELPAYNIRYSTKNMFWNMGIQAPKILRAIWKEHRFIKQWTKLNRVDAIISDNRFGCYHYSISSVFITHQIRIKIGNSFLEKIVQYWNQWIIEKFDVCWIPDFEGAPNLAGMLSHQHNLSTVQYLGALSRMATHPRPIQYDIIVVLSGPEPQRTFLEKELIHQIKNTSFRTLIVQGVTDKNKIIQITPTIQLISFLTSQKLNKAIEESKYIICRSGYSSIMDLVTLKKQAILIPTPGQTEQEYLIKHFKNSPLFVGQKQHQLNIQQGIQDLQQKKLDGKINYPRSQYETIVANFLIKLKR